MRVAFKFSVRFGHLRPEIVRAIHVAMAVYAKLGFDLLVVTSGNDGVHMRKSKHFEDAAIDIRTGHHWAEPWMTNAQAQQARDGIAAELGDDFDVLLEKDHIHIEWDPKMCLV